MPMLLVADSAEFLIGQNRPGASWNVTEDSISSLPVWTRPRGLPPTMVATFPELAEAREYRLTADRARRHLQEELEQIDLQRDQRVSFYPLGAGVALLLDRNQPGWKETYARYPFSLASLLRN
jgi:hypothetical protein